MKYTILELYQNLSRFTNRTPSLKGLHIAGVKNIDGDYLLLEPDEKVENAEEFKTDGDFKQALFKSAKSEKEKLYRDILFQSAEQSGMAYRAADGKIVFRSLLIGPEILQRYQELKQASVSANVIGIHQGFLCISHRPKFSDIFDLRDEGFTHVVTVLGQSEKARNIGREVERAKLTWIWLPLNSAKVPVENEDTIKSIEVVLCQLASLLNDDSLRCKIYLHCSAGIHRTGMISLALLRYLGNSPEKALDLLGELRGITAQGIGEERIHWALAFAEDLTNSIWNPAIEGNWESVLQRLRSNPELVRARCPLDFKYDYLELHNTSLLHFAAMNAPDTATLEFLTEQNLSVNEECTFGYTPIFLAVAFHPDLEILDFLVRRGADVNHRADWDATPLHWAARKREVKIIEYLLSHGADPLLPDGNGNTILHEAARNPDLDVLKYLVSQGLDLNSRNNAGESLLVPAVSFSSNIETIKYLQSNGCDLHEVFKEGKNLLHYAACDNPSLDVLKYLISQGLDINAVNDKGENLLQGAVLWNYDADIDKLKFLVSQGFDPKIRDGDGDTLFHLLPISKCNIETVEYLRSLGVDIYAKNNNDETFFDYIQDSLSCLDKADFEHLISLGLNPKMS